MIELNKNLRTVDLPYTIRFYGVTEEEFDELADEDTKAELIDGVMIVHSPASLRHDNRAGFLRTLMRCYAEENGLGFVLGPDAMIHLATCRKFAPAGFFLKTEQVPDPLPKEQFEVSPALVFEVLSPSNRDYDLNEKRPAYHQAGVKEVWLIDPEKQRIHVDRRRGNDYRARTVSKGRLTSAVLRAFWIDVGWLLAEPLPNVMMCLREILG
jgi:Uma2 family endonuclease